MGGAMYNTQYTVYTICDIMYIVRRELHRVHCIKRTVYGVKRIKVISNFVKNSKI